MNGDIIIGIDAGTSFIKSVAFDLTGTEIASASVQNHYLVKSDGTATQSLGQTWHDCAQTLRLLAQKVPDLAARTAALAVTGQGDGTWLIDKHSEPVGDGWLWLDARSASTANRLRQSDADLGRFQITGTGLNCCQQGAQLAHMQENMPELLNGATCALHCKDWLYLKLTGERVTDPSEANFTFGDFRKRDYDDSVLDFYGLTEKRHLLPPILDGSQFTYNLTAEAAAQTGLRQGTPVSLGYVDVVCTAMGAGAYAKGENVGCTIIGTTGMHMKACDVGSVQLNDDRTGYVMALPVPGKVCQIQSNMSSTLNIDWLLDVAADLISDMGNPVTPAAVLMKVDKWLTSSLAGTMLYQPYISEAGERGPFVNSDARAGFIGINTQHRFQHMLRAVVEGLGMASRDCYEVMGRLPGEIRLTGGAAQSTPLRGIFAATTKRPIRCSSRNEAGAAGAAMMAAVAIDVYDDMDGCVDAWVAPLLGELEQPDAALLELYDELFPHYVRARETLEPVWAGLASCQGRQQGRVK